MSEDRRRIGVYGATLVGLGGIIGGGLLILAGVAFDSAGPAAILALALDGVVAWLTAMSVTEISTTFPESARRVHVREEGADVRAAFASAGCCGSRTSSRRVLYALGFASFTVILLRAACDGLGLVHRSGWIAARCCNGARDGGHGGLLGRARADELGRRAVDRRSARWCCF